MSGMVYSVLARDKRHEIIGIVLSHATESFAKSFLENFRIIMRQRWDSIPKRNKNGTRRTGFAQIKPIASCDIVRHV
jgi:hypothetical protein